MRFCGGNRLCRQFPRAQWPKLCNALVYHTYNPGDILFSQNDAITAESCVYVVLDGVVQIFVRDGAGGGSHAHDHGDLVTVLHRGGIFGESGALGAGGERTGTAVATHHCQLVALKRYCCERRIECIPVEPLLIACMLHRAEATRWGCWTIPRCCLCRQQTTRSAS